MSEEFPYPCMYCKVAFSKAEMREAHEKECRRINLREYWIREHLPTMAIARDSYAYAGREKSKAAKEVLEYIDACLDVVCGENKK